MSGNTSADGGPFNFERHGTSVQITVQFPNEYDAMEFYDRLCKMADDGAVSINMVTDKQ